MRTRAPFFVSFGLVTALASAPLHGQGAVHVVDLDGGADFVTVQEAVDQASPGDVILVRPPDELGTAYPAVTISKGVTVLGLGSNAALEEVTVTDVPEGPPVVLANLLVSGEWNARVRIHRNLAPVWIEDCLLAHAFLDVELSDVVATELGIEGLGESLTRTGDIQYAPAVTVRDGRLALSGIVGIAGSGDYIEGFEPIEGGDGGDGLRVLGSSEVAAASSQFRGGDGDMPGALFWPTYGGDAGAGIAVDASSTVVLRATRALAGEPGFGEDGNGAPARPVEGTVLWAGDVAPTLSGIASAAESRATSLVVTGAPGAHAFLTVSDEPAWELQGLGGARLVGAPLGGAALDLGIVPASGELRASWTPPARAANGASVLHLQVSFDQGGATTYGPARAVVVLDDAWVPGRVYVDAAAAPGGDGTSWASAFDDLHAGLAASAGLVDLPTEVWVREGVYAPEPPAGSRDVHFQVESGTHVYGGFAGGETELDQRDPRAHPVVLSGDLNGDDDAPGGTYEDNSNTVLLAGAAHPLFPSAPTRYFSYAAPHVRRQNLRLDGVELRSANSKSSFGDTSGIYLVGDVALVDSVVAEHVGRVILTCFGGGAKVVHTRFVHNRSHEFLCTLVQGWNDRRVSITDEFTGCEFVENQVQYRLVQYYSKGRFTNCTFYRNHSFSSGIMFHTYFGALDFSNCIVWDNDYQQEIVDFQDGVRITHSLYDGRAGTEGNVAGPPRFVHPAGPDGVLGTPDDDLRLGPHSPCVDAGDNASLPADVFDLDGDGDVTEPLPLDLAGAPRRVDDPNAPDTGSGTPPLVDMGARERQP